jgi:hypothetical protein
MARFEYMSDEQIVAAVERYRNSGPPPKSVAVITAIFVTLAGSVLVVCLINARRQKRGRAKGGLSL